MAIISKTYDNTLQLWDVTSGSKKGGALSHTERISCVAFSPDGSTIVSGSHDNTLRLWDVVPRSQKGEALKGHTGLINDLAFYQTVQRLHPGLMIALSDYGMWHLNTNEARR